MENRTASVENSMEFPQKKLELPHDPAVSLLDEGGKWGVFQWV